MQVDICYAIVKLNKYCELGKLIERSGRKAMGLRISMTARLQIKVICACHSMGVFYIHFVSILWG